MTRPLMLEVNDLVVNYGQIKALKGVSFNICEGEIVTILGPNGAGKTTTLHTLSGLIKPIAGTIKKQNEDITKIPAHQIVAKKMAHSPEGRLIFPHLTVASNLDLGAYLRTDKLKMNEDLAAMFDLFPRLKERLNQTAGTLSGGEQQMLAIARAYMSAPDLLLLDEPSLGIAPLLVKQIFDAIKEMNKSLGMTILLVEQNARGALKIAHRAYVLNGGKITIQGNASDLLSNQDIKKAYLGY